jgi:hypothetical protein
MSHIDPFAPISSYQHPANWTPVAEPPHAPPDTDAMPHWIRLDDEPVKQDNPDAGIIGQQRWEEYRALITEYGTDAQKIRMGARTPFTEDVDGDMPTLAQLRASKVNAQAKPVPVDDLAAKLKALEEAGL